MTDPFAVLHATWPPAATRTHGPFTLREGAGGGKRVNATSTDRTPTHAELDDVDSDLFVLRQGQDDLDTMLADRGFGRVDPTLILSGPVERLFDPAPPPVSGFTVWPPLQVQREIWAAGGIGPGRLAVMDRVTGPKTSILGRARDTPAGTAFVAIHDGTAMLHAMEIRADLRRLGLATHMVRHAVRWAARHGADTFAVLLTEANDPAIRLYRGLGLEVSGATTTARGRKGCRR